MAALAGPVHEATHAASTTSKAPKHAPNHSDCSKDMPTDEPFTKGRSSENARVGHSKIHDMAESAGVAQEGINEQSLL
jgi:hypothetical protein